MMVFMNLQAQDGHVHAKVSLSVVIKCEVSMKIGCGIEWIMVLMCEDLKWTLEVES